MDGIVLIIAGAAFAAAATGTRFFSRRPRLFVRCFVPRGEVSSVFALRQFLRNRQFTQGMRVMAILQMGLAVVAFLAGVILWLRGI